VDDGLLEYVAKRAQDEGLANVSVIHAKYEDPLLPTEGVDLLFTCNTYHHLKNRAGYFRNAKKYIRPTDGVAIFEFAGKGWCDRWFGHWGRDPPPNRIEIVEVEVPGRGLP
jgi:arsenite methyltransferase